MTKQEQKWLATIKGIMKELRAEKRKFAMIDDSRGIRYLPPGYFIKLRDYKGGIEYLNWFYKNFPDDLCYPDFHFESMIIHFKMREEKIARVLALTAFSSNTYIIDRFFGKLIRPIEKDERMRTETPYYIRDFPYRSTDPELSDFADWLLLLDSAKDFVAAKMEFIDIAKQILHAKSLQKRRNLYKKQRELLAAFSA